MPTRNQTEGYRWERTVAQMLRNSGVHPAAVTTRSANRTRDGQGIDFCNEDESKHGRMMDDIQAKTTTAGLPIATLLPTMKEHDVLDQRMPVIFWRQTGKSEKGRFMVKGHFAISILEDHVKLLQYRELAKVILPHLSKVLEVMAKDPETYEAAATISRRAEELGF